MRTFIFFFILLLSTSVSADVMTHLFEWRWEDIGKECETFLGPAGYRRVQVSPPQENSVRASHPWYERYQPVSYRILSRSGDERAFREMVRRCRSAGVGIIVDVILNHMASTPSESNLRQGTGYGGGEYWRYRYPGVYTESDFHYCRGDRNTNNEIQDYGNREEVQSCELLHLPDLKTESATVQTKLAFYLNHLLDLGVEGFRIDAAKHIPATDLRAIFSRLHRKPFIYSEVIDYGDSPIKTREYRQFGRLTEFRFGMRLSETFMKGKLASLENFGEAWGFMPSTNAITFVDNHDTQRTEAARGLVLSYKTPELYYLANVFMLAWPYGQPSVMSSFPFEAFGESPPSSSPGVTLPVFGSEGRSRCGKQWVCEHRWPGIARMVGFRNSMQGDSEVTDWWSNGKNQIAFGRAKRGFVVINRESHVLERTFKTSLPPGEYCDFAGLKRSAFHCAQVANDGTALIRVEKMDAFVIGNFSSNARSK